MTDIVNIGLSVDSREVNSGRVALAGLGAQAEKTQKATEQMSAAYKVGIAAAMAAGTAAIYKTIQSHREFTKSISELSAITGAVGQDLKFYREEAKLLGSTTTFSASQVATAFKLVASAKPDLLASKESLAAVTGEVLTLAEAAGISLPEAATSLAGSLNQFSAGAEESGRFINVLAAGAKFGSSLINETSAAMKNAGAVAASLGLSFEETNAAIQLLAKGELRAAEAGTGLRSVLLKLATQSNEKFNPEIVGLQKAMKNLADANLSTSEMTKIFGQESITAAENLIKEADSLGALTQKLTGTNTAMEQARINTDNLDGDMKAMGSSWEGTALTLGEVFDPALRATVQLITWLGKVAQNAVIEFGDLGNMLGAYAAIAGAVMTLDFDKASQIIDLRRQEREETEKKIDALWGEKTAIEVTSQAEVAAAETSKQIAEAEAQRKEAEKEKLNEDLMKRVEAINNSFLTENEQYQINYAQQQNDLALAHQNKLITDMEYQDAKTRLEEQHAAKRKKIADMEAKAKMNITTSMLGNMATLMSSSSKKEFEIGKAFALAQATMKGFEAWNSSFAAGALIGGPALGYAYAATSAVATAMQIRSISSQQLGGGAAAPTAPSSTAPMTNPAAPAATPWANQPKEQEKITREVIVTVESDGPHSEGMREFARNLADTIKDMGSDVELVIS